MASLEKRDERVIRKKEVTNGVHQILTSFDSLYCTTDKLQGLESWKKLTSSITTLRKILSRLETHSYDILTSRFERTLTPPDSSQINMPSWNKKVKNNRKKDSAADMRKGDGTVELVELPLAPAQTVYQEPPDWFTILRDTTLSLPLQKLFDKDKLIDVLITAIVSPLEFFVVREKHLDKLAEIEDVLATCQDAMKKYKLLIEDRLIGSACLVPFGTTLVRAVIRCTGTDDVQVFFVDYGMSCFTSPNDCYCLPRCVANMAPPLAHWCTLSDADCREMDVAAMKSFQQVVTKSASVTLRTHGESRKGHGELVDIITEESIC